MHTRPLPELVYRAHANTEGPLDPSPATGYYRYDDPRKSAAQFHVLYTGDTVEGCFIEKLQRYRGSDSDALAILKEIEHFDDAAVMPTPDVIPADVLRNLAASVLRFLDVTRHVVQIDDAGNIAELQQIGLAMGLDLPKDRVLKPGDVLHSDYHIAQCLSVVIFEVLKMVGSAARSSLDSPSHPIVHTNFNLFRRTPAEGSDPLVPIERVETHRALDHYRTELQSAIAYLNASPALPLDHPDLAAR